MGIVQFVFWMVFVRSPSSIESSLFEEGAVLPLEELSFLHFFRCRGKVAGIGHHQSGGTLVIRTCHEDHMGKRLG